MSSRESMDIGVSSSRRRGSAPKAGSVWESSMKIDQVKGGIKVFKATDENSEENTQNSEIKQSPIGKRKTWKSESLDGSPVKIAALRSDLSRSLDEPSRELSDGIKRSPIQIKKTSLRRMKDDDGNEGNLKREIKNCVVDDEREKKPRSDECEEVGASEEIKAVVTSNVNQINGGDEVDLDEKDKEIQVESKC